MCIHSTGHQGAKISQIVKKKEKRSLHLPHYLRIENAEGYVLIGVYLFIYLYACYSHNSKSIERNRMKFGGMIGYYPVTI